MYYECFTLFWSVLTLIMNRQVYVHIQDYGLHQPAGFCDCEPDFITSECKYSYRNQGYHTTDIACISGYSGQATQIIGKISEFGEIKRLEVLFNIREILEIKVYKNHITFLYLAHTFFCQ